MTYLNPENKNNVKIDKNFKQNFPGTVIAFRQMIQNKYRYYDAFPVVLGIRLIGNRLFGVNLKLIPYRDRIRILAEMQKEKNKNPKNNKILITNLINSKYGKFLAAAFESYHVRNIKGGILVLNESQYLDASTNNYNSIKNIKKNVLNNVIKQKINSITSPMGYIITVIKNTIRIKKNGKQ
jgi:hypothetical protein